MINTSVNVKNLHSQLYSIPWYAVTFPVLNLLENFLTNQELHNSVPNCLHGHLAGLEWSSFTGDAPSNTIVVVLKYVSQAQVGKPITFEQMNLQNCLQYHRNGKVLVAKRILCTCILNYRPISIAPILSKVYAKFVSHKLCSFCGKYVFFFSAALFSYIWKV